MTDLARLFTFRARHSASLSLGDLLDDAKRMRAKLLAKSESKRKRSKPRRAPPVRRCDDEEDDEALPLPPIAPEEE